MKLSREAKLISGITLLIVPTVMYGGVTLLGILTHGVAGVAPSGLALNETQWSLFRAGHAHAGVWIVVSLVIQILLDSANLSPAMVRLARITAPVAAATVSGGFFGVAFYPEFRWLIYFGALCLFVAVILTGIGLVRKERVSD